MTESPRKLPVAMFASLLASSGMRLVAVDDGGPERKRRERDPGSENDPPDEAITETRQQRRSRERKERKAGERNHMTNHTAIDVDALANEIRRLTGRSTPASEAFAEALMPFLQSAFAAYEAAQWQPIEWIEAAKSIVSEGLYYGLPQVSDDAIPTDLPQSIAREAIAAFLAAAEADGFVLVPVEVTEKMSDSFFHALRFGYDEHKKERQQNKQGWTMQSQFIWSAMIAARPEPEPRD